jgi:hypothetical protein
VGGGYDPSYCTAVKSDKNITVAGGNIQIESRLTADGGKGLSADGDIVIGGGNLWITTAGDGNVYKDETGATNSYTAACLKSNQNISLHGGKITCSSSGTGGKGINADGGITIGIAGANDANLLLTVTTSGERFYVSGNSNGGAQGGRPNGTFGSNNTDYANPKAIKCDGDMTVNSGTVFVNCTQKSEGGEGLESKKTLTVNGGIIDVRTYDDCINAGTAIVTFSDPRLVSGTYTLLSGGSISGGAAANGYNTGGTYSGGTSKAFTL